MSKPNGSLEQGNQDGPGENEKNIIKSIIDNYRQLEESLANQLAMKMPSHGPTTGSYREEIWMSLFEQIIPRKFCIDQGVFIIDSYGQISPEIDIAIFDEQYTPYIFKYGKIKFIPIEAVAVAVQCKSSSTKGADDWAGSIKKLKTSLSSVVRTINGVVDNDLDNALRNLQESVRKGENPSRHKKSQTSTRPILVLCAMVENNAFTKLRKNECEFDFILNVDKEGELSKIIPEKNSNFHEWYEELNHYGWGRYGETVQEKLKAIANTDVSGIKDNLTMLEVYDSENNENVILSLTFQLNQLLMLINNPIFFPHRAYVKMFNKTMKPGADRGDGK